MRTPVVALALALVVTAVVPAPAGAAAEVAWSKTVAGSASFGARIVAPPSGQFALEVASNGPLAGSVEGFGLWYYDDAKSFVFGIAVSGGVSRERTVLVVNPAGPDAPAPAEVAVSPLDGGSVRFTITAPPGAVRHAVAWGAGLAEARFTVYGDPGTLVAVNDGAAHAVGDAEFEDGVNVQVRKDYATFQGVGAKALVDASVGLDVERSLYGIWSIGGFKRVCHWSSTLTCVHPYAECAKAARQPCAPERASWEGPAASGVGGRVFTQHDPAGAWRFTVDAAVDPLFGTWNAYRTPAGQVWLNLGEHGASLVVADVAIP